MLLNKKLVVVVVFTLALLLITSCSAEAPPGYCEEREIVMCTSDRMCKAFCLFLGTAENYVGGYCSKSKGMQPRGWFSNRCVCTIKCGNRADGRCYCPSPPHAKPLPVPEEKQMMPPAAGNDTREGMGALD
ncbi:hypothetical protein BS78_05G277800 [Paspalum vaginatum]|nr:hypothetical protein BS78_05G277800 [Paspalum vaginatum]